MQAHESLVWSDAAVRVQGRMVLAFTPRAEFAGDRTYLDVCSVAVSCEIGEWLPLSAAAEVRNSADIASERLSPAINLSAGGQ